MTAPDPNAGVHAFLRRQGLLRDGEHAEFTPLAGGVSSDLWKVDLPGRTVCVKGALAQLKVAQEWLAPVSRNRVEYTWLQFAAAVTPGQVPRVLGYDGEAGLFAMEFHPDSAVRFATDDNFDALRIDPYLRVTARAHPDLREQFDALASTTAGTHLAVVHGDVSPKNVLLGPNGPVLLDAECAWFGDPAFDVAFCLNHLLLKAVKLPSHATELRSAAQALVDGHARHLGWEPPDTFGRRVAALLPALALARVDGTSPVEYLDTAQRQLVRTIGRTLLQKPAPTVAEVLDHWAPASGATTATSTRLSRVGNWRSNDL